MGLFDIVNFARRKKYDYHPQPMDETIVLNGIPTRSTDVGLDRYTRDLIARNPNVGTENVPWNGEQGDTFKRLNNFTRQDQSTIAQQPEQVRGPYVPPDAEEAPIMPRSQAAPVFTPIDPLQRQPTPAPDAVDESQQIAPNTRARRVEPPTFEPIEYDPTQSANRPRWSSPVNRELTRNALTREAYEHPDKAHGLRRFAPVLEDFERGIQTTGSLTGGLGGALAGLVTSAVDPRAGNKLKYGRQLSESDARLQGLQKQQSATLDTAVKTAGLEETKARTYKLLHPEAKDPKTFQGVDGLQYTLSSDGKTATEIQGQGRKTAQPKVLHTVNRGSKVWYETEEGLKPALDPTTGKQIKSDLVPVKLQNGQRIWVTPAEALRAVTEGRRTTNSTRNSQALRDFQTQTRAIDKDNQRAEREYNEAWSDAERFNKLHDEVDKMYAGFRSATKKEDKDYYNAEALRLKAQMNSLYSSLMDKYKGTNYIQYDDTERFVRGTRPEPKDYPDAPELTFDEGIQVEGEGDGEETPPARPRVRGQSASPSGPPWTEEQVRARAKARGKNEDAAVEAARKHGQLK